MAYQNQTFEDNVTVLNAAMMKHIEDGIVAVENIANKATPKTQAANKTTLGLVKQSALVAEAAGENVTKAEFKALLDALKAAGIMANA